jgi:hypothetical protein
MSSPVRVSASPAVKFVSAEISTVSQVATPRAERTRTNWLVQVVPVYSAVRPPEPVSKRAEVRVVKVGGTAKVEVTVPVALMLLAVIVPATPKEVKGEVVPIPKKPLR